MSRFAPHAVPLRDSRTKAEVTAAGRRLITLINNPMPHIRLTGELGYENGYDNPYSDPDSPEAVNWDAGYRDARQRDS